MSGKIKFMDSILRNIKPEKKRVVYWCDGCPGFGLRVTPAGSKTFVYKYSKGKKTHWMTIGKYPEWSIRKARGKYDELYEQVRDYGRDIVKEVKDKEALDRSRLLVKDLLVEYVGIGHQKGKVSIEHEKKALELDVIPEIGNKYVDDVLPKDIEFIQNNILHRGEKYSQMYKRRAPQKGRSTLKHTLDYTYRLFNLAIKKGIVETNPVSKIESLGTNHVRDRVLNFKEIWKFWNGIESVGLFLVTANLLKFMLVTMQRGKEVRHMKYASIYEDEKIWHMTMEETKNRTMHRVPLNTQALEILRKVKPYTENSKYVFGSTKAVISKKIKESQNLLPIKKDTISQAISRKRNMLGIDHFTPHDLRRTAATWIVGVGLHSHYAKLMLNHKDKSSDMTNTVYVQYSYDIEKRKAADVWSFVLDKIVTAPSVDDVPTLDEMREMVQESGLL